MLRLDCCIDDCGLALTSPTKASILNAFLRHYEDRHPERELDAGTLEAAIPRITYTPSPRL